MKSNIRKLLSKFKKYSFQDISRSLLVASLWPSNISVFCRHQYLVEIFASCDPKKLRTQNSISNYSDFKKLYNYLYGLVEQFPTLDDYVPELDWGEVRYPYKGKEYKILYGCELENVYDQIKSLELLADSLSFDSKHLLDTLEYVDLFVRHFDISSFIPSENSIHPGHSELPPKDFWHYIIERIEGFKEAVDQDFVFKNSISIGTWNLSKVSDLSSFSQRLFMGDLLPSFFIKNVEDFTPILPRRALPIALTSISAELTEILNVFCNRKLTHLVGKL